MVAGRYIRRLEAGFPLIDTPNTDKALRTLRRVSDIEVQEWAGDNIRVYVSKEYPESTIVHELLHVILRLQGYPTVAVDETRVTTQLPEAMRACMPVLRGSLASTADHPEIYPDFADSRGRVFINCCESTQTFQRSSLHRAIWSPLLWR